ncbi:MAG: class I SAM-dependent methyltransferase [Sulfuritalea sp.]|nr:class I SAM-dependent methyltransferase [Sulfuritalea sp.]
MRAKDMSSDRSLFQAFVNPIWIAQRGLWREIQVLVKHVSPEKGQTWLDVGCGERPYSALFAAASYIGLDVQASGRPSAMKRADVTYDGKRFPIAKGSVDGVVCTQVLEHVDQPERFVLELARVLHDGGWLVFSAPLFWQEHEVPYDFCRFTSYGMQALFERSGFDVIEIRKSSGAIEALAQGASVYAFENLQLPVPGFGRLITLAVCGPIQLAGVLLQWMLPDRGDLYLDLVILARRRSEDGAV